MREAVALKAVTLNVGVARFAHFISKIKGNTSCLFENFVCGPDSCLKENVGKYGIRYFMLVQKVLSLREYSGKGAFNLNIYITMQCI